ncbi:hypothetical protein EJB05_57833, partial [Eragrostis curvula]
MALLPRHSLLLLMLAMAVQASAPPPLKRNFYAASCPRAEAIVRCVVRRRAALDRSVLPAMIRLHFHDCFVRAHLPSPSVPFAEALSAFRNIGLSLLDLTALLGSHTMGFCHCGLILDRLYSFNGTGRSDPTMDAGLLATLRDRCPPHTVTPQNESRDAIVPMNLVAPLGPFGLDNSFFPTVLAGRAVLQFDQELTSSSMARRIAAMFAAQPRNFQKQFARSMVKLGSVNVLTGKQGEVRLNCRRDNGTII